MNGLIIKDILMSEMKDRMLPKGANIHDFTLELHRIWKQEPKRFTHDQVIEVGGEYLKFAGDGSAVNAINCGCASPSFPREDVDFVNTGEI